MSGRKYPLNTSEVAWEEPRASFYPRGVKEKILWENPETGAMIALIKYPAGAVGNAHTHPKANEAGYYLEGEVESQEGNRIAVQGWFGFTPKGVEHGKMKATKETVVLLYWDGPR